jgi:hypothetical protein
MIRFIDSLPEPGPYRSKVYGFVKELKERPDVWAVYGEHRLSRLTKASIPKPLRPYITIRNIKETDGRFTAYLKWKGSHV